ncbi:TPA: restriction endonuclease subunit S [Vibrio parahaemolyticus]|uniref:Restriction modification system DNA specificity domain protein n=1 Tax=Vibrio alginolyticus (strain ATCC 17749 / DSM 2171 / NBRC 15630 / NCIMB 1903 / NCTC 12160 / XII-53) TaxID=1219076 RepID=A0A2I3CCB8_VIBAX|nr:restriction endonuclease subunit S [Vibrio alginolyticus]MDF4307619.1 restriction endonuclease subunit S [Vibrio parahaemolyticus]AGV17851.1 restriction modification system DNA specificity domain protein [Vibrio alginolyticus NBRC 15630 = ATCC 17749]MBY7680807.1 restriction endonuclease subunit S [Vibrio alginolyticus]MCR9322322.1 restriction endonuclease subunit S [Vibrio alginolyticus]MCR9415227.1 restriction endonuclease subunit S [Vibrio alginolyticus]
MNNLTYLEKLLDGVDVEWKKLTDVFQLKNGYTPSKSKKEFWENGTVPWFRMDDIRENGQVLDGSLQKVSESAIKGGKLFPANSIIIATSATIGEHALVRVPFLANQRFTNLSLKPDYKDTFNSKFIFYYCFILADWCKKNTTMSSFASVDMDGFKKFLFPIPCPDNPEKSLAIQAEIVRILDAFTELTAELTAELNLRKKQYNYYRDKLLSFKYDEVEWKTLEEVAHFANGKGHEKDISEDGKFIVVNSKFISTDGLVAKYSHSQICPLFKDDILLVMSDLPNGKALSKTFLVDEDEKYTLNQRIGRITVKDKSEMLPKFLHYFLDRTPQLLKHNNGVDQTNLRKGQILEVKVPIISLQKQTHIVNILDKFDKLTKSLSEGLPREIELRQKQYEYYRDLLLSFPKSNEGAA